MCIKVKSVFFYVENGLAASTDPGWTHTVFNTLTGLFDRAGTKKNVKKTMGMVCHLCRVDGVQADEAYTRRMTGAGRSYRERHRERVN